MRTAILIVLLGLLASTADAETRLLRFPDLHGDTVVFTGPLVALLDEDSASDGDIFPGAFKALGPGPLIGKRSWGGIIGITDLGPLVDGGSVYVPQFATASADGQWTIEGVGVAPDIEVDNPPDAVLRGEDPQLQRAIEEALQRLRTRPGTLPQRPADPVKTPGSGAR